MSPLLEIIFALLILVVVIVTVALTWHGLREAWRFALKTNTTRGFLNNAWDSMAFHNGLGLGLVVLAGLPLLLLASLVVAIRLVCGVNGAITGRNVLGLVVGVAVGPAAACILSFVWVFVVGLFVEPRTLVSGTFSVIHGFFANWWLLAILAVPVGAIVGFSNTAPRTPAVDSIGATGIDEHKHSEVVPTSAKESEQCYVCGKPLQTDEIAARVCHGCRA